MTPYTLLLFLTAVLPGLLICWYIYRMDKYEREAPLPLIITFLLGAAITYPVLKIETWASGFEWLDKGGLLVTVFSSFIIVSLTEEGVKYFALLAYPFRSAFFNEPMDGIVYAVMIGMGFATLENVLYATQFGMETTLLRAFTAVPAHAAFAVIMGYFCGRAKFSDSKAGQRRLLGVSFLAPFGIHGIYDFFILQEAYDRLVILALVVLGASLVLSRELLLQQQQASPFREEEEE
jgi:RsiW-degrading membrane proteinase PrsW (M82 family)